jgi:hypothetical protein
MRAKTLQGTPIEILKEQFDQSGHLAGLVILAYPDDRSRSFRTTISPSGIAGGYTQRGKPPPPVSKPFMPEFRLPEKPPESVSVTSVANDKGAKALGML